MLGQISRGGNARAPCRDDQSLDEPKASPRMKQPPTERERAIAQQRAEGRTLQRIGREFGLMPETVRSICRRVEEYDRGSAMLRNDPTSIEALALLGHIKPLVRETLRYRGVRQLTDLEGVTMGELVRWPNVGRQSAALLLNALTNVKKNG